MGTGQGCGTLGMLRMDVCPRGWLRPAALLLTGKPPSVPHFPPRAEHRAAPLLPLVSAQLSSAHCRDGAAAQRSPCAPGSRSQSQPHGPINVNGNGNRRRLLPAPCQHSRSSHTPPRSAVPPPRPMAALEDPRGHRSAGCHVSLLQQSQQGGQVKAAQGPAERCRNAQPPLWGEEDVGGEGTQPSSSHTALCGVPAAMAAPSHD